MNPLNLIPAQFRMLALAIAIFASFASGTTIGWTVNGWRLNAKYDAERLVAEKAAKAAYDAKAKQYNEASAALEASRNEREIVYRTITKTVEKVIERDVYRTDCVDSDGVRLINDALAGRASDHAKPDAAMSAAVAP